MARPISKTTKFILALPRTLSANEVLAKAKASGHKTSEGNIYRVRRLHGGNKAKAKPAAASANPSKAVGGTAARSTKSEFVRGFSRSTKAKDVVAKARAAGVDIDLQYVYKIRSRSSSGRKRVTVATPAQVIVAKTKTNGSHHSSTENLLRAVAAELGLGHAVEILQSERARVRAAFGG
jgi:hypothetical protein